ncbi:MAG: hypothetical protein JO060_05690 [Candidatus Eremiobacteraeota bacterium]|nr:hypothetical protein [Candidatus Eremiobacteraeota bacterium]
MTYGALPQLDPDDCIAVDILRKRGIRVAAAVWDDTSVDWSESRLCVLRSTWDYPAHYAAFMSWLERVSVVTRIENAPALVRWNSDKRYLRDLEKAGVPTVPTEYVLPGETTPLDEICVRRGFHDIVVKPSRGAGTVGVKRFRAASRRAAQAHLDCLLHSGGALIQPFLSSVETYPERALVFIDGAYSHAVTKTPFQALLPAGQAGEAAVLATREEIDVGHSAIDAVAGRSLYGRVDVVRDDDERLRVLELELIEPSLFFSMHPPAAEAFADAIVRRL